MTIDLSWSVHRVNFSVFLQKKTKQSTDGLVDDIMSMTRRCLSTFPILRRPKCGSIFLHTRIAFQLFGG